MKKESIKTALMNNFIAILLVAVVMTLKTDRHDPVQENKIEKASGIVEINHDAEFGNTVENHITKAIEYEVPSDFVPFDCILSEELQEYTYYICKAYNIDFTFFMSVMEHESRYVTNAVSSTDDYGLMQINKCNHEWLSKKLGITDFLDPYQNIYAGAYILRRLFEKYDGNPDMVLMAYNMGEGGANRLWRQGIYETNYTDAVFGIIEAKGEAQ